MPDLHGWITQQIDSVEEAACAHQQPSDHWEFDDLLSEVRDLTNAGTVANVYRAATGIHIALHDPAAVLRRCAADRKILTEHRPQGGGYPSHYACEGCGYDGSYCPSPLTGHINDCPTLIALAEGYGLTEEQRAQLDRPSPQPPRRQPVNLSSMFADAIRLFEGTSTADVPPALRGPNWRAPKEPQ